jgi:beta-aspartyl-peptidase (threonine type)
MTASRFYALLLLWFTFLSSAGAQPAYSIAIHGGAGTILRSQLSPEQDSLYRAALHAALDIGEGILAKGGTALDAVEATLVYLEEHPLFNAGRGAVLTHEGYAELDASIMDGRNRQAGAVGGVQIVRSPIRLARAVMERSPHVFLTGRGAEQFALEMGLDTVPNTYFHTPARQRGLERAKAAEQSGGYLAPEETDYKFGTVGCVALDQHGNLAAGTSTGGMTNKRWNRIGDAPIIGAGTFADNATCAVSCTGHGEYFIREAVAYDVSARMRYLGEDVETATRAIIHGTLKARGGSGGLIAVDRDGNISMPFNTEGMYRGYARAGERMVAIYEEE